MEDEGIPPSSESFEDAFDSPDDVVLDPSSDSVDDVAAEEERVDEPAVLVAKRLHSHSRLC